MLRYTFILALNVMLLYSCGSNNEDYWYNRYNYSGNGQYYYDRTRPYDSSYYDYVRVNPYSYNSYYYRSPQYTYNPYTYYNSWIHPTYQTSLYSYLRCRYPYVVTYSSYYRYSCYFPRRYSFYALAADYLDRAIYNLMGHQWNQFDQNIQMAYQQFPNNHIFARQLEQVVHGSVDETNRNQSGQIVMDVLGKLSMELIPESTVNNRKN